MIVLDTNVVSELMRPEPSERVVAWWRRQDVLELCTTAVNMAEIGYGLARLPPGRRREHLEETASDVLARFGDEALPFDAPAAHRFGLLVALREEAGRPIDTFDAQIAAICLATGHPLATRNTKDFEGTGVTLIHPWE